MENYEKKKVWLKTLIDIIEKFKLLDEISKKFVNKILEQNSFELAEKFNENSNLAHDFPVELWTEIFLNFRYQNPDNFNIVNQNEKELFTKIESRSKIMMDTIRVEDYFLMDSRDEIENYIHEIYSIFNKIKSLKTRNDNIGSLLLSESINSKNSFLCLNFKYDNDRIFFDEIVDSFDKEMKEINTWIETNTFVVESPIRNITICRPFFI